MLLEITPYQPSPSSKQLANIEGSIINKGIELSLNGYIITKNDLEWSIGGNFTKINNTVKDLPVTLIETGRASGRGYTGARVQVIMNDQPINVFYGYKWIGFVDSGKTRGFDKFETDTAGKNVEQVLGSSLPDFYYNLSSNLRYKNIDVGVNFEGVYGNLIFNNLRNIIGRKANISQTLNVVPEAINSPESVENPNRFSDRWLESGSYFRLSNLTIGYTIPVKGINWLKGLRVYATGSNLFLITKYKGYDPDVNTDASYENVQSMGIDFTNYPKPRTYMAGLSVTF
jgi:iron complex outermembrane receptor protein